MKIVAKFFALSAMLAALVPLALADGVAIYNTIPSPLPPNVTSMPYEAGGASEFGNLIEFAGGGSSYNLINATVAMSVWAPASDWQQLNGGFNCPVSLNCSASGFYIPLTLNLYNVGPGNTVGSLIATENINAFIP